MHIFGHCKFLPVFLYQKGFNKFQMHTFGHSEFIPVFLGKIARKNLEQPFWPFQIHTVFLENIVRKNLEEPFLAIPNLYRLFGENCWKKFGMAIFGHSEFTPVFLGKIVGKNSEQPFLAILNLHQSFWGKLLEKIQNGYKFFCTYHFNRV